MADDGLAEYGQSLKEEAEEALWNYQAHQLQLTNLAKYDEEILKLVAAKKAEKEKLNGDINQLRAEAEIKVNTYNDFASAACDSLSLPLMKIPPNKSLISNASVSSSPQHAFSGGIIPNPHAHVRSTIKSNTSGMAHDPYSVLTNSRAPTNLNRPLSNVSSKKSSQGPANNSSSEKGLIDLEDWPILMEHPKAKGSWVLLHCPICKGNTRSDGCLLKGTMGVKRHVRMAHQDKYDSLSPDELFGRDGIEKLIMRYYTNQEVLDMRRGIDPMPPIILCRGALDEDDDEFSKPLRAYDAFEKYPTIVCRDDGVWMELRCPICGGNSIDGQYIRGVHGFRQHLTSDHSYTESNDGSSSAMWIVAHCSVRDVNEFEMIAHVSDEPTLPAPSIIPCRSKQHGQDRDDSPPIREAKRLKAAEQSSPIEQPTLLLTEHEHKSPPVAPIPEENNEPLFVPKSVNLEKHNWSDYCPCTVSTHACKLDTCQKIKVCTKAVHNKSCEPSVSHDFLSTCVSAALGGCQYDEECEYAHEDLEERKEIILTHKCENH